mgnify:CR=1 FL=1
MMGRTTVIISHRISAVQAAAHIIVLAHGRVADAGTGWADAGAGSPPQEDASASTRLTAKFRIRMDSFFSQAASKAA